MLSRARAPLGISLLLAATLLLGCPMDPDADPTPTILTDGPIAEGIAAKLGQPLPSASADQLETFERGKRVFLRRFDLVDGLGPTFNLNSCGGCHEKPVPGGSAGLYRNFFLAGRETTDGAFVFSDSDGMAGGVLRAFSFREGGSARPIVPDDTDTFAQRNPIAFFGMGLIAEVSEEEILRRADPTDADGDGISGKPNFDRGFVGRFGRKAQTVSLEGFIRGPLFNHLGVTTEPLSDELRAQLPVDSSLNLDASAKGRGPGPFRPDNKQGPHEQAAAADAPNFDDDNAPDPELSQQNLFDLVAFQMLMAAPRFEEPTERSNRGRLLFHEARCSACHVPRLTGPRGPIPAYSDLLLHDMGPDLADGIVMKDATGSEFRTQPLWGVAATAPYLHDGRAATIHDAILWHGGEAENARRAFEAFTSEQREDIVEFILTLGGRDQASAGLLPPDAPIPGVGEYGGPRRALDAFEAELFRRGRAVFDRDFAFSDGVGGLTGPDDTGRFNGDSCRACHFDPVIGGAGPRDVSVMRHGVLSDDGSFSPPPTTPNTILHRHVRPDHAMIEPTAECNVFEIRQTPHVFGGGLISAISDEAIAANADPDDADHDGISGRAHTLADGRIGRFGWKADVPSVPEFIRDAMAAELGITLARQSGLTFGITEDDDGVPDPELALGDVEAMTFFLLELAPPPRDRTGDPGAIERGETLFTAIGCAVCHVPSMPTTLGPDANLYSDLLLHDILPPDTPGIVSGDAAQTEFRTAPLWGLSRTAPYFHDGSADTIQQAILQHDGEALGIRSTYQQLSREERADILAFLGSL